ncbi:Hypothetical_protein [Hexamita inflata]|uniref:Hypothetical_protein n=1 Tax=Hexamita inflata TaxID=28002 RepID=A0AA86QC36_9EUKA|nr:Hypothetical protein HINF_LOCUS37972 [Hexamita inflata]CAI9964294.1 Hypothetical protein HINF_LOCUS51939 [Hexamita inflata]
MQTNYYLLKYYQNILFSYLHIIAKIQIQKISFVIINVQKYNIIYIYQAAKKKTFGTTGSRVVSQRGTRGCLTRLHFAIWNKMRCSTGSMTEPTAFPLFSGLCLHAALCSERDTSRERSENIRMNNFQCVSSLGSCISCGRLVKLLNSKYFL